MHDQIAHNRRRAALLGGAFAGVVFVVLALVLLLIGLGLVGVVLALVVGLAAAAAVVLRSDAVVVRLAHATDADEQVHARLHNVVDGLCLTHGLPKPRLCTVDDPAPNALAAGRSRDHAVLIVTTGLLDALDRIELEGVLAHELSHIRTEDIVPATVAVGVFGWIAPGMVERFVDDDREQDADASAVSMTRYPPGLIGALEKLQASDATVSGASRALAALWIEPPAPPEILEQRIAVLREL